MDDSGKAVFVLVHGMWHGAWCWQRLTPRLRAAGHAVHTVTLTGLGARAHLRYDDIDMDTHIQDVVGLVETEDLRKVVLVGHSLAGFMVPAVAERVPQRTAHIVSLDGPLPEDGVAFKDIRPALYADFTRRAREAGHPGWAPPHPENTYGLAGADLDWVRAHLTPHPLKTWETPLRLGSPAARGIPRTLILCTDHKPPEEIASKEAIARQLGWRLVRLAAGHDAMVSAPAELANLLVGLA